MDRTEFQSSSPSVPNFIEMDHKSPNLTIVLFGSTSAVYFGKENFLLRREQPSQSGRDFSLVVPRRNILGRNVSVINILSLQDAELYLDSVDQLTGQLVDKNEIHAFIFVLTLSQITDTDKLGLDWLQSKFGKSVLPYVMILFTYEKEDCDIITEELKKNQIVEDLLKKCGNRYLTCSKRMNNQTEMRTLMEKLDKLVSENKQQCYTAEMYHTALKLREDHQERRSKKSGILTEMQKPTDKSALLCFNVILTGNKGAGKTSTGNTILGTYIKKFSGSQCVQKECVIIDGVKLNVYDTPGQYDPGVNTKDIMKKKNVLSQLDESVPTVILQIIKADAFAREEKSTIQNSARKRDGFSINTEERIWHFEKLPQWLHQNTWILFTGGDVLERENLTIEEVIEENEELKRIIQRLQNRYHIFNKKNQIKDQVRKLIEKIKETPLNMSPKMTRFPRTKSPEPEKNSNERRIVLLGKTGVGKSATGNTILGENRFRSELHFSSVTSQSEMHQVVVSGRKVIVVDTPGLFDTQISPEDLKVEIGRSIYMSSPGPHAFLYVHQINVRFTEQEEEVVDILEMMFGEELRKYMIILFTHGDMLEKEDVDTLIKKNSALSKLVEKCRGYHIFNNKDKSNRQQVTELLEKIDRMLEQNGGSCYSNQMFEDAARFRREDEESSKKHEQSQTEIEREKGVGEEIRTEQEKSQIEKEQIKPPFIINQPRGGKIGQRWMEMRSQVEEFKRKLYKERKKMDQEEIQAEIQRGRLNKSGEAKVCRKEEVKFTEREKMFVVHKSYLRQKEIIGAKELDSGLGTFLRAHGNHLTAAGQAGAGYKVVVGTSAGLAVGAGVGAAVGLAAGPVGAAIGLAFGGAVGAICGAFTARNYNSKTDVFSKKKHR